jgi:plastocyanin
MGGQSKDQKFEDVGEYTIYCDIHKSMVAYVKVVKSTWIAEAKNETFKFTGVPPGKYDVVAWRPNSPEVSELVTVTDGGEATVHELHLKEMPEPPHVRRDGSSYPRYDNER